MFLNRGQLIGRAMNGYPADVLIWQHIQQEGQPNHMIEVGVREKNIQFGSPQKFSGAVHGRARVEDDAQLGNHEASRVAFIIGMVARGSQQNELHGSAQSKTAASLVRSSPSIQTM
jgi:hypothetical protein